MTPGRARSVAETLADETRRDAVAIGGLILGLAVAGLLLLELGWNVAPAATPAPSYTVGTAAPPEPARRTLAFLSTEEWLAAHGYRSAAQ